MDFCYGSRINNMTISVVCTRLKGLHACYVEDGNIVFVSASQKDRGCAEVILVAEILVVAVCIKIFCPGTDAESTSHVTRDGSWCTQISVAVPFLTEQGLQYCYPTKPNYCVPLA